MIAIIASQVGWDVYIAKVFVGLRSECGLRFYFFVLVFFKNPTSSVKQIEQVFF